ncbi:prepilin-type N-terminal cleavage/methylation domain-containing protein [Photorhabdus temperata]|uniref:Prepilin-type N-terminal cleavage/methylation domain-containing protein n=1 Tax=Photorhabdus temperata J3 TaxID=1389415 RepID=U7R605_PHOTE|nr:hypothetical protein O185_00060 [Photorhabdus temperata J3]
MENNINIIGSYNIDNQLGFSLLELMIVIVLISIFSLWGIQEWVIIRKEPGYRSQYRKY